MILQIGKNGFAFQPVIGYRTGIATKHEIGITQYGLYSQVIDYKHQFLQKESFILSGDLAAFSFDLRPYGVQYDLLFGNKSLYGIVGFNYHEETYWIIGVGSESKMIKPLGFQLSIANDFINDEGDRHHSKYISVGIKCDIQKVKKRYR